MRAPDSSECVFGRFAGFIATPEKVPAPLALRPPPAYAVRCDNKGETPMAKKARKKASKKSTKKPTKKSAVKSKAKKKSPAKKRSAAKKRKKPAAKGIGARVTSAYRTVVDTFTGTDQLRNKIEQKGTSESE
jgi:hypothetical protein